MANEALGSDKEVECASSDVVHPNHYIVGYLISFHRVFLLQLPSHLHFNIKESLLEGTHLSEYRKSPRASPGPQQCCGSAAERGSWGPTDKGYPISGLSLGQVRHYTRRPTLC